MQDNEMFAQLDSEALREKVFQRLVDESPEIQVQMKNNELMKVKSYKRVKNELIVFRSLPDQPEKQEVIVSFIIEPERYFMKTQLIQKDKNCYIKLSPLLYKLQRRKNFRLSLPHYWKPQFNCVEQNTDKVNKTFKLHDLSSGGFSFEYTPGEFEVIIDAEIEGQIKVHEKLDFNAIGIVKHYREVGTKARPLIRVGLEFKNLGKQEESDIMSLLMEVHREVFSKLS